MIRIEITGTALYSDLLAKAARDEYNALLNVGIGFEDAENFVIEAFCGGNSFFPEHESVFWLGLACAEHKFGALSDRVRERALRAIDGGEDIKKWENAAKYDPYYRYISRNDDDDRNLEILVGIAQKKYNEKLCDCTEEGVWEFQMNLVNKLIKDYPKYKKLMPQKNEKKPDKPVDDPGIEPDKFFMEIRKIGGGCQKNFEARKKVLEETREYLTTPQERKKPKKAAAVKCPWEAGDIVAVKTCNAGKSTGDINYEKLYGEKPPCSYEDGKYILLLILKVIKTPIGQLVPVEAAANEDAIIGFYDYYGDEPPKKDELANIPFMRETGPYKSVHTGHRVYFEGHTRLLKKTEWEVIGHYEGFPENIPEFFKEGVMGSSLMAFGNEVFGFVPARRKSGKYEIN